MVLNCIAAYDKVVVRSYRLDWIFENISRAVFMLSPGSAIPLPHDKISLEYFEHTYI